MTECYSILDNVRLTELARKAAEIEGYEGSVAAEYVITPTKLSVKWQRTFDWVQFKVSHWIADMEDDLVIEVFMKSFYFIKNGQADTTKSDALSEWVNKNKHKWRGEE